MASIGQTKKLIAGVGRQLGGMARKINNSEQDFAQAVKSAEEILDGSSTSVVDNVVGKMKTAVAAAQTAQEKINAAAAACTSYAEETL